MNLIELNDIKKIYNKGKKKVDALKNLSVKIAEGELVAIMGTSGSGKTTLLNILGFLDTPSNGSYIFKGEKVDTLNNKTLARYRNEQLGFVVQNFALINDFTAYENIMIPLDYSGKKVSNKREKIKILLEKLNISEKIDSQIKELSGGQCQRVAIARALVNNPSLILADEPTGALDSKTGDEVMGILKDLNKEGKTVIIVTHDINIANQCNRVIKIIDGEIKEDIIY